ncbi:uncharacterized protein [Aegilops tauschii subsp. strangulata]|uniref:uncharacterized protein n=1 Tax=Aegilops tauschii subsp. strangulata TaxID=200361 RepID=UPI001ABD4016|nr:uncharacterized protein LOC120974013 [Aegilops tauschii subsp. strangulata]
MDRGSSLNLIYTDTIIRMGINSSWVKPSITTFKNVIPGVEAHCMGTVTLEVVFGSPENLRSEELTFDIVPFHRGYHTLLGCTTLDRLNAVPHYAYLKLKLPGPDDVITINGNTQCSLRTKEQTTAFAAEVQASEEATRLGKRTPAHQSIRGSCQPTLDKHSSTITRGMGSSHASP